MLSVLTWDYSMANLRCLHASLGRPSESCMKLRGVIKCRNWKNKWRERLRTRNLSSNNNSMLKIHFTAPQWRELSRSWREWSCRTLMKRSLKTTSTTKIPLKTQSLTITVQSFHFGVSPPRKAEGSMLLPSAGIPGTRIFLQWDMVHMISWSRTLV